MLALEATRPQAEAAVAGLALCALLLCALAGCTAQPLAAATGAAEISGGLDLPAPHVAIRRAVYVNSKRTREASYYTPVDDGAPTHIAVVETNLLLMPEWGSSQPAGIAQTARALYAFDIPGYYLPAEVNLGWIDPPNPADLWIGLANWGHDRWDWYQGTPSRVPLPGLAAYQSAEHGVLVAVVLLGQQQALLDWVRVGPKLWTIEAVTSGGDYGQYCSLELDAADLPHIACYDAEFTRLMYYHNSGSEWNGTVVDHVDNTGLYCSLALKGTGEPGIAYFNATAYRLKLAVLYEGAWQISTVDSSDDAGINPALRYDSNDRPHIAYFKPAYTLAYAAYNGVHWDYAVVDPGNVASEGSISLVLAPGDSPRIAYSTADGINYAWHDGAVWQTQTVAAGGISLNTNKALALDSLQRPSIAAFDVAAGLPAFYSNHTGAWFNLAPPLAAPSGSSMSLAFDALDQPHVACYGAGLEYGVMQTGTWHMTTVDDSGWTGHYTSVAIDSSNNPHIGYYHPGNKQLMYASYSE